MLLISPKKERLQTLASEVARGFRSRAAHADAQAALPAEDVQALRDSGLLTLPVPKRYGGAEASLGDCVQVMLKLAQGSTASALVATMPLHILGHAREAPAWADALPLLAELSMSGAVINTVASEPELGSPSRGGLAATMLKKSATGYVLSGHKTWATGGEHLTQLLVQASFEGESVRVLVPNHLPGIRWDKVWGKGLSLRASDSHDVYFDDVALAEDVFIQPSNSGHPKHPNAWFTLLVAAVYLGTALAARDSAIAYAQQRVPTALGKPIASLAKVQRQLGEIDVALQAAQSLLLDVAHAWQGNAEDMARVISAKHFAIETALQVTDNTLRLAGGASLSKDLPLERHFRDVRAGLMHPPSGDAALELVGQAALKRPSNL